MDYTFDIEHNTVVIINTNTKVVLCHGEDFKYYFADFVLKGGGGGYPPNP